MTPLQKLQHHVSGAIERGEAVPITQLPQPRCQFCNVPIARPPSAPHKSFCSTAHRMAYHARRRTEAFALLRQAEGQVTSHQPKEPSQLNPPTKLN